MMEDFIRIEILQFLFRHTLTHGLMDSWTTHGLMDSWMDSNHGLKQSTPLLNL